MQNNVKNIQVYTFNGDKKLFPLHFPILIAGKPSFRYAFCLKKLFKQIFLLNSKPGQNYRHFSHFMDKVNVLSFDNFFQCHLLHIEISVSILSLQSLLGVLYIGFSFSEFLLMTLHFLKKYHPCPPQPPTERVPKINKIVNF